MKASLMNTFHEYFYGLIHPFKVQEGFYFSRKKLRSMPQLRLATWGESSPSSSTHSYTLDIAELASVSWFFVILKCIYSLVSLNLGILFYQSYFSDNIQGFEELFSSVTLQGQKILILYIIGEAALYPIFLWFYFKLWSVLIKFFGTLFDIDEDIDEISEQIVSYSLVSHLFLLIPILGEALHRFASLFYIYVGLVKNMRLTLLQSVIVITSPLLLVLCFFLMIFAYIAAVLSVL